MVEQFFFCPAKIPCTEKVQILQDEKRLLVQLRQRLAQRLLRGVDAGVAERVIQVAQGELDIIQRIGPRVGRHKIPQRAEAVARGVQQMADLKRVPVRHLRPAADETTGVFWLCRLFQQRPIAQKIIRGQIVQQNHHVDIAVFGRLAAQIAALQSDVAQPCAEFQLQRLS